MGVAGRVRKKRGMAAMEVNGGSLVEDEERRV